MSIFDLTYIDRNTELLPPHKRKPKYLALIRVLSEPMQYLHDLFFTDYLNGSNAPIYIAGLYNPGDRVRWIDNGIYEAIVVTGNDPSIASDWMRVQDVFIGLNERAAYNSQKIVLEFLLNRYFAPNTTDIYITNNPLNNNVFIIGETEFQSSIVYASEFYSTNFVRDAYAFNTFSFTVFIPTAVFAALNNEEGVIRAIADKYVLAGITYDIQTY